MKKGDNFSDRLKEARSSLGISQAKLANKLGVTGNYIYLIESGAKSPGSDFIARFELLVSGKSANYSNAAPASPPPRAPRLVPVVSWARAGSEGFNYGDLSEQIDERVETDCRDENAYALIVEGDSMEPRFLAGDRVICAPNSEPRNGDFVVARLKESGSVLFKRFKRAGHNGDTIRLESLNPDYDTVEYPANAFRIIHPVVDARMKVR